MKLSDDQLAELERIQERACCSEPERRFMAEAQNAELRAKAEELVAIPFEPMYWDEMMQAKYELVAALRGEGWKRVRCNSCGHILKDSPHF